MKPLKAGQPILIKLEDLPYGRVATYVADYLGEEDGVDYYLVPIVTAVRLPRNKIWDYDIQADNCRGGGEQEK